MQWAKTFCPDDEDYYSSILTCILLQPPRLRAFSHDLLNIQCFARQSINLQQDMEASRPSTSYKNNNQNSNHHYPTKTLQHVIR